MYWWLVKRVSAYAPSFASLVTMRLVSGRTTLTEIVIPDSVVYIGSNAFYNCTNLTSVVIGNNVTRIGDKAFQSCTSLSSIVIPDSVAYLGKYAFSKIIRHKTFETTEQNDKIKADTILP